MMKHKLIPLLLAGLTLLSACGKQQPETVTEAMPSETADAAEASTAPPTTETAEPPVTAPPEPEPVPDRLKEDLNAIAERYGATGAAVAVLTDGQVTGTYVYGVRDRAAGTPVTEDTKFRAASLSKLVIAMVACIAEAQGVIDLQADIGTYLGYPVRNPYYPGTPITGQMLLCHVSSIGNSSAFLISRNTHSSASLQTLLSSADAYLHTAPGTYDFYSNLGAATLAAAIETAAGKPFETLSRELLFAPMGLDCAFLAADIATQEQISTLYFADGSTGMSLRQQLDENACETPGQTHHLYQGNLTISAKDYAKLLTLLLNDGVYNGTRLLPPGAADEMLRAHFDSAPTEGYGVYLLPNLLPKRTVWGHTGSNFGVYNGFAITPDEKNGVVVFTNGAVGDDGPDGFYGVCTEIVRAVYAHIDETSPK